MSKDFKPSKIISLTGGDPWSIAGVQAFRNSSAMSYKLLRTAHTETAIAQQVDFEPSVAPTADEAVLVYADASLVDPGDYTVANGIVTFDVAPGVGVVVRVDYKSAAAADIVAGTIVWLDVHRLNLPAWDSIIPTDNEVLEVM